MVEWLSITRYAKNDNRVYGKFVNFHSAHLEPCSLDAVALAPSDAPNYLPVSVKEYLSTKEI